MKICPKCLNEHEKQGTYCSRKCANSRQWSEEAKQKRGESLKKYIKDNPLWHERRAETKDQRIVTQKKTLYEINLAKFLAGKITDRAVLKKWLIETKGEHCSICKMLPEWNGNPLSLQVHHANGINNDNRPDNVSLVCPNCHSQTETFAGKCRK